MVEGTTHITIPVKAFSEHVPMNKYQRTVVNKHGSLVIDVYDVLDAWGVTNPALAHMIKKALQPGERGHKDAHEDYADIVASAKRAQEVYLSRCELVNLPEITKTVNMPEVRGCILDTPEVT